MLRIVRLCVLFFAVLVATSWMAAPVLSQTNEAAARALFDEGRALTKEGKHAEACAKFEASQKLEAKASTALNLATCYEKQQKYATAWSTFGTAATLAKREGHAERETYARKQMAAMENKLAKLTINVGSSQEGLQVTLDGKPVIDAMFGTALPIDPGSHELAATAPNKKAWSKQFVVPAEKVSIAETIPMLEDAETAPTPVVLPTPDPATAPTPTQPAPAPPAMPGPPARGSTSPLVYIGFSLAGVGVVVGTITGIIAIANTSSIKDNCNEDLCPATESESIDDANLVANVANVSFAVGAVGAVLGVIGLFLGDDGARGSDREAARWEPVLGPGHAGIRGAF